jgi:hypothetical protein
MMLRPALAVLIAAVASAAISCQESDFTSDLPQPLLEAEVEVETELRSEAQSRVEQAIRAQDLLPLEPRTRLFQIIDGDRIGEKLPLSLRRTGPQEPGQWVLEFSDLNMLYLRVRAEGDVEIVRLDLPAEGHAVVYSPPVRMLPAHIRPHIHIEEQSVARVYDLETGKLKHTGQVTHKVRFASRSRLVTEVGAWDGYLIPVEHEIDLGAANVQLHLVAGYVPGLGIVYRRMDYTRLVLGIFGQTERRTAVLAEEP